MKKMSKRAKIVVFALAAAAAALLTAYFIGKNYFAAHFLPGTVINGIDCGGDTAQEVKDKLQDTLLDYSLELKERGGKTEAITAGQLGVEYTDDGGVERLLEEQKETLWFLAVTGPESMRPRRILPTVPESWIRFWQISAALTPSRRCRPRTLMWRMTEAPLW